MEVSLPIVSRATCQAGYPHEHIDETMICASYLEAVKTPARGIQGVRWCVKKTTSCSLRV